MTAVRSRPVPCPTCCPVAVRSPTPPRGSTSPPPGASSTCPRPPAATATRSSRQRPRASSAAWSSAASTWATWPTPSWPARPWTPPASWSPWRCATPTSPGPPTWSSRSHRSPTSPAPSSTGRAGSARSARSCTTRARCPTCGCWPASPRSSAPRWASAPPSRSGPRWTRSVRGTASAPWSTDPVRRDDDAVHLTELGEESDELVLASWKQLLDDGRMQDGDDAMRRTARGRSSWSDPATLAAARRAAPATWSP